MLNEVIGYAFLLLELACGVAIIVRFRGSPGAILGGIAFGVWVAINITRRVLGAFAFPWWDYDLWFTLPNLGAYGCLLAALVTGRVYGQSRGPLGEGGEVLGDHMPGAPTSFVGWYPYVLRKYAVFTGRARRQEYWAFFLFNILIGFALGFIEGISGIAPETGMSVFGTLYSLAVFLPGLAVAVRRLHDTGRSGWWLLISLVPFVGSIVLLVFMVQDSHPGENQYGPNPKGVAG